MTRRVLVILLLVLSLVGCTQAATPTAISPTNAPASMGEAAPEAPSEENAVPTEEGGASAETFTLVGNTATLAGSDAITGKAIVAGLQTLIIVSFTYDGKAPADLRLIMADKPDAPVLIVAKLERAYDNEMLQFKLPNGMVLGSANTIAVYDTEAGLVLASGQFH
ncbi:MAG: DM13 domain-containing protein [Chloroflexi bacterium]|nr:DM13 domain-containing protein [Chloroflexota bacterium]